MRIVKYGSSGCGPCSRMSHYDEKVVKELGLDFEYVKKRTPDYNSPGNEEIKGQLDRIPSPTYVLVEGNKVLGTAYGGCEKGLFRVKIKRLLEEAEVGTFCEPKIQSIKVSEGSICPKGNGAEATIEISTSCCEPNDAQFRIDPDGKGYQNMRGMDGVSFPNAGGGNNDHGDGKEIKHVHIDCDEFEYDIKDHDWNIRWSGNCDQSPGEELSASQKFTASDECDPVDECEDDKDCPPGYVCKNGKCKKEEDECEKDKDCDPGEICVDGECVKGCRDDEDCPDGQVCQNGLCVTPLPDTIEPEEYDCECPPEVIQLWFDDERGIYGATYDKDRISSIQYMDAWDPEKRALKLWLRPGGCNLDDVCECVNLCAQTTAAGYPITDMQTECETNEKENSVTLTFTGSWIEPNTGQGGASEEPEEGEEPDEPDVDTFGPDEPPCIKGDGHNHGSSRPGCCTDKKSDEFYWKNYGGSIDGCAGEDINVNFGTNGCPTGDPCGYKGNLEYIVYIKDGSGDWIEYDSNDGSIKGPDWMEDDTEYDAYCIAVCGNMKVEGMCFGNGCLDGEGEFTIKTDGCSGGGSPSPSPEPSPEPEADPCEDVECPDCHECKDGDCVSICHEDEICVDGECQPPFVEMSGNFYPNCINIQCCPDCDDEVPPFEPGDNDDCDNKPDPNPVPGTDGPAAAVYLYDRLNHTYVFCCPILADVTWLLPFDAIPPVFQRYITAAATVRAAAQLVNNPQLFQLLKDRENTLRMECMNYELEQGDLTFLGQPDHTAYVGYQPIQTLNR